MNHAAYVASCVYACLYACVFSCVHVMCCERNSRSVVGKG